MLAAKKTGKKRTNRSFTIMVLPHSGGKPVSFPLRASWLKAGAGFLTVAILSVGILAARYSRISGDMRRNVAELEHLKETNADQNSLIDGYQAEAQRVEARLRELEELDRQVREMIDQESAVLSSRSSGRQARAPREQRLAMIEVSRSGFGLRRDGLFAGLAEEAQARLDSLGALKEDLAEVVRYLKAKPATWPVRGSITSAFGYRRSPMSRSKSEFHEGIDIGAPYGAQISATGGGMIVFAGYHGGLGRTVIIDHDYGIRSWYGHCQKIIVRQGDRVGRGQVIAQVGSSGYSTGPHLHYQVTVNGKYVDPRDFIQDSGSQ